MQIIPASMLLMVILITNLFMSSSYAARTHPSTGEILANRQAFIYRTGAEPPSYDPQLVEDVEGSSITRDLFEGLLTQNADGTLAPGVAERWESNDQKTRYTFYLRKNARWSDGTSDHIFYTIDAARFTLVP